MQLLKIKVQVSSIWAKGCMLDDCMSVISYLAIWHDYPSLVEGKSNGILLFLMNE